jgi:transcriptional regulator
MVDAVQKTQMNRGAKNPQCKLTEAQVKEIRALYESGVSQSRIAEQFGVLQQHVSLIVRRVSWAWL